VRPERLVLVCGTATEVGKTWVGARLLREVAGRGHTVAARKPAQSFDIDTDGGRLGGATDAEVLGAASGEHPGTVCHSFRSYHRAMAPPMAAEALGLPAFTVADLVGEMEWPVDPVDVGVVEMAGGVRSPQASDGDTTDFVSALAPDTVVLVADAGLGTINSVRLSMDALTTVTGREPGVPVVVVLDRFDGHHDIHRRNRRWLTDRLGYEVVILPGDEARLADLVCSTGPPGAGQQPQPPVVRRRIRPPPPRPC
jgi:dethiobiotin synthetase